MVRAELSVCAWGRAGGLQSIFGRVFVGALLVGMIGEFMALWAGMLDVYKRSLRVFVEVSLCWLSCIVLTMERSFMISRKKQ